MSRSLEDQRWDEAIDYLLNGRHLSRHIKEIIFDYTDGAISRAEMKDELS